MGKLKHKINTSASEGFTIIEVVIVLAVAAVIIMMVFLAWPALKREQRNTARNHDAAFISIERQEYDQNEGTTQPKTPAMATCSSASLGVSTFGNFCAYVAPGLTYYDINNVTIINNASIRPTTFPPVTPETIVSESYATCDSNGTTPISTNASVYSVAVIYALDGGSGAQVNKCLGATIGVQ